MRLLGLLLIAMSLGAQAPSGAARVRFGNGSSDAFSRIGMGATGAAWDFGDSVGGETVVSYGGLPNFTQITTTNLTCAKKVGGTGTCGQTFNGSTDYVYQSDTPENSPTSTYTVSTVAKIATQSDGTLISKWGAGSNAFTMFFGAGTATDKMDCYLVQSDTSTIVAGNTVYTPGEWAAWTCQADGTTLRLFKNGRQVGTTASYDGTVRDSNQPLIVGVLGTAITFFLNGDVAYASFTKSVLSAQDISRSYKALRNSLCNTYPATGAGTFCTDLPQ